HDLLLGRLAENAHVRNAAVCGEKARTGGIPSIFSSHEVRVPLCLLDLSGNAGDHHVAFQLDPCILQRVHGFHVTGERPFHVRDTEAIDPSVLDEAFRLETANPCQPPLLPRVRGIHVPVEHERLPTARPFPEADDVRTAVLDLLPLDLNPHAGELIAHALTHRLLVAGR